jgi:hypothetical protein
MRFSTLILATATEGARIARQAPGDEKRYSQLVDMMGHYNSEFDERKYWAYGCNCLILGDRPMSDPGHGPPVDALDTVCKAYKDCLKCARMKHGDTCIGEFVKYRYGYKNGDAVCKNNLGSCERDLCECDAMFAKAHVAKKDVFDVKYHMFWSTTNNYPMWDPANDASLCPSGGGGTFTPECCQAQDQSTPFIWFNAASKTCCSDGRVVASASQC